ncbi:MAG TPA: GNAT family N-acetyltransferase [Solirubrobacterales bacterium]|nr:GNAT family N-acetyltransferase [Solirubrobacterales bacterium]
MPAEVVPVTPRRRAATAAAIARGFLDNEVWVWMVPDERRRRRLLDRYYRVMIKRIFAPRGGAWTTADAAGGALWAPPGTWPLTPAETRWDLYALLPWIGIGGIRRGHDVDRVMGGRHPKRPHYYLQTLSIDPARQRRGYGSALLRPLLERCDAEGMPAYLETQRESNIPFYRRFGFVEDTPIRLPGGPPLWPMWREPAVAAGPEHADAAVGEPA